MTKSVLLQTAREHRGNIKQMAKSLGLTRASVYYNLMKLNISPDKFRK
jgi:transcriptional regulator of acetoin/glycerol metabolism